MKRWLKKFFVCSLLFLGCSEYKIQEFSEPVSGAPNPIVVEAEGQHDTITQVLHPEVDVMFVIDDSCSMSDEQVKLMISFPEFVKYFTNTNLDYHIGVITTDMVSWEKSGKLQYSNQFNPPYKWIDTNTPNPEVVFSLNADVGIYGSYFEKGMEAIEASLTTEYNDHNAGFFRDDAALHIIIISDEDDASILHDAEFYNFLDTLKSREDTVFVHGIYGLLPAGCASDAGPISGHADPGRRYDSLITVFKGEKHSICEEEWRTILDDIGLAASGLKTSFFLTAVPNPVTLEVWVEEGDYMYFFEQGEDYAYDRIGNSISFATYQPPRGATVHLEYEIASSYIGTYSEEFKDTGI